MNSSRRVFLKRCGLLAASGSILSSWRGASANGVEAEGVRTAVPLSRVDRAVLDFVGEYGETTRLVGGSLLARLRGRRDQGTRVLVRIADAASLSVVWTSTGLPRDGVYARENTLCFSNGGSDFSVENLLPAAFAERTRALRSLRGTTFAHDALRFDPASGLLADPLGAIESHSLKLYHPGRNLPAAFDTVLRGWIDSAALDLPLGAALGRLQSRVFNASGARRTLAEAITSTLLRRLATVANSVPAEMVQELFRSRLVSTSLQTTRGIAGETLARKFERTRRRAPSSTSDAGVWLAVIVGVELRDGVVDITGALESSNRFETLRSRAALAEAREILADPAMAETSSI